MRPVRQVLAAVARLCAVSLACGAGRGPVAAAEARFDESRLEREILATGLVDAIQFSVAPDGDVYVIERAGALKRISAADRAVHLVGSVPVAVGGEYGLIGLALAPDFAGSRALYLLSAPAADRGKRLHVTRHTLGTDGTLPPDAGTVVIAYEIRGSGHQGGSLLFDTAGDLWIGTGDDTPANIAPATDERPGREGANALRTAANSLDLRGKILRIRPRPDGGYTVPAGNLFADPAAGRPEIYVMGCRNPYRFFYDAPAGLLYWGEVGSNTEERFGSGGYDEFSRTAAPGNSGWPLFIGPNAPYRRYDHAAGTLGAPYDPARPVNDSRLNTGLRELPPPIHPVLWYGSEDSREFPELGNGGRSAVAGPVYRFDPALASAVKLPAEFDGRFFIADWCRSWIKTVSFAADGTVAGLAPFLGRVLLNRPIDLKFGPDGALYLLEFGAKWSGNTDGTLSRVVYRRGNRPPLAVAAADVVAGAAPLTVRFSARGSRDPDGDGLRYDWQFGEKGAGQTGADVTWTYAGPGLRTAALVVTDSHGLSHRTAVTVAVGNAPPVVRIGAPAHGSFFEWGQPLSFAVTVTDPEDGSTVDGAIAPAAVQARWHYRDELPSDQGPAAALGSDPGAAIMRRSDCLSCHQVAAPSIGPSFLGIAERYRGDTGASARLAAKIREGGAGAWGDVPMPPHPQHTAAEAAAMAGTILAVRPPSRGEPFAGLSGPLPVLARPRNPMHEKNAGGSYVFTVAYRDRGAAGAPPLTGEARAVVHARRRRAALFDAGEGVTVMEVSTLRRDRRVCAQLQAGGYLCIRAVNLAGIARIACEVSAGTDHGGTLELRADGVDGPLIGRVEVPETGLWENWRTVSASVVDPGGVRDLYVVARSDPTRTSRRLNLDVLEFVPAPPPGGS